VVRVSHSANDCCFPCCQQWVLMSLSPKPCGIAGQRDILLLCCKNSVLSESWMEWLHGCTAVGLDWLTLILRVIKEYTDTLSPSHSCLQICFDLCTGVTVIFAYSYMQRLQWHQYKGQSMPADSCVKVTKICQFIVFFCKDSTLIQCIL